MLKISEKMTKRIKAKIMKNQENGKNLTKPIEAITKNSLAKSQNETNLKNQSYKTISFKTPVLEKALFTKPIEAENLFLRPFLDSYQRLLDDAKGGAAELGALDFMGVRTFPNHNRGDRPVHDSDTFSLESITLIVVSRHGLFSQKVHE